MDYIHIDNLFFSGKHGVYSKERKVEQEFLISIKIGFDTSASAKSDTLKDTVDYQKTKDIVSSVIKGKTRYLIEALAEDIASQILEDNRIKSVEVVIKKTAVWDNGVPGVTIVRTR
ncbi:dihydroneopterin aldolase [Candidatus Kaiserbacteria bacterium RIFCSPHIGHO2_01_FULL_49_13]|uniref:7,8-dihydroneopterin aldolase n=1 Tax=Candidatus Kaiserbacteria bacterium RIFCSPHIGHO2_01_FULL_49_13 TaxID=1798477 RepID=A0A1F6CE99_9BACT|nr:MAG: dihydroneopterin aldolase [Candidatus Kaiserbacteria bacterium RIFCSPHIGHO2_01_FULL_49_13]